MVEITKEKALPDRLDEIQVSESHFVNKKNIKNYSLKDYSEVLLGLGCFWGAERLFWTLPFVHITSVGYGGGYTKNATYQDVCSGGTGHAELVKVVFENKKNNFAKIIKVFFENHDPTQGMRQGNDIGSQYRSCIYTSNENDYQRSIELLKNYQKVLNDNNLNNLITTEVKTNIKFFYAEDYHQQYLAKNPQGYCGIQGLGLNLNID